MSNSPSKKIINLCLKNHDYLKTLQKALVFDEQDNNSFQNTYHQILDEIIQSNWQIHNIATDIEQENFSLEQLSTEFSDEQKKRQQSN